MALTKSASDRCFGGFLSSGPGRILLFGQRFAIAAKQPSGLGMINPDPSRPEYRGQQRFGMPGWDVHDEMTNAALADGLQVVANSAEVHAIHKRRFWFKHWPGLDHEFRQPSSCLLRFQSKSAERRPSHGGLPAAGCRRQ